MFKKRGKARRWNVSVNILHKFFAFFHFFFFLFQTTTHLDHEQAVRQTKLNKGAMHCATFEKKKVKKLKKERKERKKISASDKNSVF